MSRFGERRPARLRYAWSRMPNSSRSVAAYWIWGVCITAAGAMVWFLGVMVMPGEGWERPGRVTGFGLVLLVAVVIIALSMHEKGWEETERGRTERRRRRREWEGPDAHG